MNHDHSTYLARLVEGLKTLSGVPFLLARLGERIESVLALALLDLEPARPVLRACYVERKGGRPPRDPVAMLRSLVLMALLGVTSFNSWVLRLRGEPELAVLSGFEPEDTPGVGTYYDWLYRLLDGPRPAEGQKLPRPSQALRGARGRFQRKLKAEKLEAKACTQAELAGQSEGRVAAEVRKAMASLEGAIVPDLQACIQELLTRCALVHSASRGLLGDLLRLCIVGDGTSLESGAAPHGKRQCDCPPEAGRSSCDCARTYSDPTATWGWDSHRQRYVFGHRLHVLSTGAAGHDLPLHLAIAGAHEPDVVMAVDALVQLVKHLRAAGIDARIACSLWDKGYDAEAFYRLNLALGATPFIPLAQPLRTPQDEHNRPRDEHGTPLCSGGAPMWRHGYNKLTGKVVFACPAKRPSRKGGEREIYADIARCPKGCLCEPDSKMGPLVHLDVADNPRLNPPVPRDSERFIETYKARSGAERIFSFMKERGGLGGRPWRRRHFFLIGALANALAMHAKAWVAQQFGDERPKDTEDLLPVLAGLAGNAPAAQAA